MTICGPSNDDSREPARCPQDRRRRACRRCRGTPVGVGPGRTQARRHAARQQRRRSARLRCPPDRDVPDPVCRRRRATRRCCASIPTTTTSCIPDLAEKTDVSADGKTVTFHIRSGVNFHNGTPLTAEDVIYSLERIRKPPRGIVSPRKGLLGNVDWHRGARCRAPWSSI